MSAYIPIKPNPIIRVMDKLIKNKKFYCEKINEGYYRGSEPSVNQIAELSKKGIKIILNLKSIGKKELQTFAQEAEKNGMRYINIPLNPFRIKKSFPYIMKALQSASKEKPLFIHCTFGEDRTGFVSALVNYLKNNFTMKDAIKDMTLRGCESPLFLNLKRYLIDFDKRMKLASYTGRFY